jgi:hypothetical protein
VVGKDIKTGNLVLTRKKNWENLGKLHESWEGPYIAKNRHGRGFSFARTEWRRVTIFVECWQPKKVLPLKIPELDRFTLECFLFSLVY